VLAIACRPHREYDVDVAVVVPRGGHRLAHVLVDDGIERHAHAVVLEESTERFLAQLRQQVTT
jgi:hypothetical protein